jgi:hypothetical protein
MDPTPGCKLKVEGKKFRRPTNRMTPIKREFLSTTQGLEKNTFAVGYREIHCKVSKVAISIKVSP